MTFGTSDTVFGTDFGQSPSERQIPQLGHTRVYFARLLRRRACGRTRGQCDPLREREAKRWRGAWCVSRKRSGGECWQAGGRRRTAWRLCSPPLVPILAVPSPRHRLRLGAGRGPGEGFLRSVAPDPALPSRCATRRAFEVRLIPPAPSIHGKTIGPRYGIRSCNECFSSGAARAFGPEFPSGLV